MARILVLYYSSWGHMEAMSMAAAEGARSTGATVDVKRVPEIVPPEVSKAMGFKLEQDAPLARPSDLENYDGFILGVSTRYGLMTAQFKYFFDQTGELFERGALVDKVATVMSSAANQHGGVENAILTAQHMLQHHGVIIVPLGYTYAGQKGSDMVRGGSPYGMTTSANSDGSRLPSAQELEGARAQGKRLTENATRLHG